MSISPKQQRMLMFIQQFIEQHGYPPTYEEIRVGLRISTKSLVYYHLQALEGAGYVEKMPGKPRGIQLR